MRSCRWLGPASTVGAQRSFVQVRGDVSSLNLAHAEVRHSGLWLESGCVTYPVYEPGRIVRVPASYVHPFNEVVERRADVAACTGNSRDAMTGTAFVGDQRGPASPGIAAHDDRLHIAAPAASAHREGRECHAAGFAEEDLSRQQLHSCANR